MLLQVFYQPQDAAAKTDKKYHSEVSQLYCIQLHCVGTSPCAKSLQKERFADTKFLVCT